MNRSEPVIPFLCRPAPFMRWAPACWFTKCRNPLTLPTVSMIGADRNLPRVSCTLKNPWPWQTRLLAAGLSHCRLCRMGNARSCASLNTLSWKY